MQTIEIIAAIIALVYIYLEYKASKWLWPVGVIMPILYIWIFFQSKIYAYMGINIYYFFASIYGWIRWTRPTPDKGELPITHTPKRLFLPLGVIGAAIYAAIAFVLIRFTDSPVPYVDSFTSALSIIAMWLLAHKHVEQWLLWIAVNAVSCGLYAWQGLYPTSILFAIYTVISILGYFKWLRMMSSEAEKSLRTSS